MAKLKNGAVKFILFQNKGKTRPCIIDGRHTESQEAIKESFSFFIGDSQKINTILKSVGIVVLSQLKGKKRAVNEFAGLVLKSILEKSNVSFVWDDVKHSLVGNVVFSGIDSSGNITSLSEENINLILKTNNEVSDNLLWLSVEFYGDDWARSMAKASTRRIAKQKAGE